MDREDLIDGVFIAYWERQDQIVIYHRRIFGSIVEFDGGFKCMSCELGPESDFILLGLL